MIFYRHWQVTPFWTASGKTRCFDPPPSCLTSTGRLQNASGSQLHNIGDVLKTSTYFFPAREQMWLVCSKSLSKCLKVIPVTNLLHMWSNKWTILLWLSTLYSCWPSPNATSVHSSSSGSNPLLVMACGIPSFQNFLGGPVPISWWSPIICSFRSSIFFHSHYLTISPPSFHFRSF